jgi:hypothetical protein
MLIGSKLCGFAAAGALLGGAGFAAAAPTAALASGGSTHVCSGSPSAPGVLAGSYGNVAVSGICFVNSGPAVVHGNLTVRPGGALLAVFAMNDRTGSGSSHLTVTGDVNVDKDGTMLLGCFATSFACLDDPDQNNPTLNSHSHVEGNIVETDPLGVILHDDRVDGNVTEVGGGGGFNCNPKGVFAVFGSPVYSDYEDSGIGGSLSISHLTSCWLGVARVNVYGSLSFADNRLADPDAIEILSNFVAHNLSCTGNTMVWDSADETNNLYPRALERNHVAGQRSGQCVLSSPVKPGGTPGPWKF